MLEGLSSVLYRESYNFITPNSHPIVVAAIQWSFHYNELPEACYDLVLLTNGLILLQIHHKKNIFDHICDTVV